MLPGERGIGKVAVLEGEKIREDVERDPGAHSLRAVSDLNLPRNEGQIARIRMCAGAPHPTLLISRTSTSQLAGALTNVSNL